MFKPIQIAARAGTHVSNVKNVIIWGNHSSTQYPDVNHGTVDGKPIRQVLKGDDDWLDNEFVETVQQRGAAVIKVRCACFTLGVAWPGL
jgi:malate dehydrogenase